MSISQDVNEFIELTRELCRYATGVVADDNLPLFERIDRELTLELFRYASGSTFNGWEVPQNWRVQKAELWRDGVLVFDGTAHTLGVARYSKSFEGELEWADLQTHLVTNADLPDAYMFHCMWQYRPWDADWALCVPFEIFNQLGPGRYRVNLKTEYEPGEMLVAHHIKRGRSDKTVIFQSNTCHPHMANDGFAGTAVLIRLFQWLMTQDTHYSYRLVLGPEHLGTVFYLENLSPEILNSFVCGVFEEMPGTLGPLKATSTYLGDQVIDAAFQNVMGHHSANFEQVPWRMGAGNDEVVWEAPGYEVPFVEFTRSESVEKPFREYHSSLDSPELMNVTQMTEMLETLKKVVSVFEGNAVMHRKFNGLICLSNPQYDLYMERPDPTVIKEITDESETWGHLLDCLFRYFDGKTSILEIATRHNLPFDELRNYLLRFEEKDLISIQFQEISRPKAEYV